MQDNSLCWNRSITCRWWWRRPW